MTIFRSVALTVVALFALPAARAQTLLGNSFDGVLYDVNIATGAATNPRSTGKGVNSLTGIAFGPSGTLYGLTTFAGTPGNSLVTIDPVTGSSTSIGFTGLVVAEGDLAFDPISGVLFGMQHVPIDRQLFTMNVATGAGTVVGSLGGTETIEPSAMTFAPDGTLYILDTGSILGDGTKLPTRLLTVDKSNAATRTSITLPVNLGFTAGMDFHPATGTLYVADGGLGDGTDSLYSIDPTSGAMALVGPTGVVDGLAGLVFAIPEPSSAAMASIACLIALAMRRNLTPSILNPSSPA